MVSVFEEDRGREGEVYSDCMEQQNGIENGDEGEPTVGMIFKEHEEVYLFYKAYGKSKGFGICRRDSKKNEMTGDVRWMTFTCTKAREHKSKGKNLLAPRPSRRISCGARVCTAKREGLWMISKVVLGHNHEISLTSSRFIRQHREVDVHSKRQLELNDMAGLRPCQNVKAVIYEAGGHEEMTCLSVDLTNHVNKVRRLQLKDGDAEAIHELFGKLQTESRDFVYVIKPDKEGRLKHVFWADGRCRAAYQEFCDVITFDTTYLVNKYDMPFASFVGVNQHRQSILLGCALINNEKSKTYKWLFETCLNCMDGKWPNAIITDQCGTIGEAVRTVFPNTRHRWCLWHILCKIPSKFTRNDEYDDVKDAFMEAVYDTLTVENFEEKWSSMLFNFQLESNEWLANMYENRQRWVPVFVRSSFWAGMSSTQRSESMHSFFDGFVHARTSLSQFAQQYGLAVQDKVEKEKQEDFLSLNSIIPCVTRFKFEVQFRNAYSNNIFRLVQQQLTNIMYCDMKIVTQVGTNVICEVVEMVESGSESNTWFRFIVQFDVENQTFECNCKLFEFMGILCAHVFKVIAIHDIQVIPDRYILRRWRKDVVRRHSSMTTGLPSALITIQRTKQLENAFYYIVEKTVNEESKFESFLRILHDHKSSLDNATSGCPGSFGQQNGNSGHGEGKDDESSKNSSKITYKDPVIVRRRGRPKNKRLVPSFEKASRKTFTRRRQKSVRTPHSVQNISGPSASLLQQQVNGVQLQPPGVYSIWPMGSFGAPIPLDTGSQVMLRQSHLPAESHQSFFGLAPPNLYPLNT